MKPKPPVDEPRREKENMEEPQEEFIEPTATPSHSGRRNGQPQQPEQ